MPFPDRPDELLVPWKPSGETPWDRQRIGHLLRRAGLGGTHREIEEALEGGPEATLDRVFTPVETDTHRTIRGMARTLLATGETPVLAAWWLRIMLETPDPLREKCAVIWHGHFAVSDAKVQSADQMYDYYTLLHARGLGDLRELARRMVRCPAMLVFLDADANRKGQPNENLARELFELFLLGIGHYSEHDIREAARALTGLRVERGRARFVAKLHDEGTKEIFSRSGRFDAVELVDLCFEQESCARHLAGRLAMSFTHPELPPRILAALGDWLRELDFRADAFLRRLFETRLFHDPACYRARIKSPVELAIGAYRSLEQRVDTQALHEELSAMGQELFRPPGVQGWSGGDDWISSGRMVARNRLAARIAGADPGLETEDLLRVLLDGQVPAATRDLLCDAELSPGGRLQALLTLPEYQLA